MNWISSVEDERPPRRQAEQQRFSPQSMPVMGSAVGSVALRRTWPDLVYVTRPIELLQRLQVF